MQGWRLEMEDAHIAQEIPSKPDHVFVAVFDGHGGAGAAKYAEEKMIPIVEATDEWNAYLAGGATDMKLLGDALKRAFVRIDEAMKVQQDSTMGKDGADTSGCTSVTAMITPTHIICANAGDSRCCMGQAGTFYPMSEDHKPYDALERERIEAAGGTVQWKRVDGDLAVSRALGDFQYKQRSDLPPEQQKVSCEPDIKWWERKPTDEVLLLACDGLWDVMSNQEAIDAIRAIFATGESNAQLVAEEMIDLALEKGASVCLQSCTGVAPLLHHSLSFARRPLTLSLPSLSHLSLRRLSRQHQRRGGGAARGDNCLLGGRWRGRPASQARPGKSRAQAPGSGPGSGSGRAR